MKSRAAELTGKLEVRAAFDAPFSHPDRPRRAPSAPTGPPLRRCCAAWGSLLEVARPALMAQREHSDHVMRFVEAVERDVPVLPAGNDQLSESVGVVPPDEGVSTQHRECSHEPAPHGDCAFRVTLDEKLREAVEVCDSPPREDDQRQETTRGGLALLPLSRVMNHFSTSSSRKPSPVRSISASAARASA